MNWLGTLSRIYEEKQETKDKERTRCDSNPPSKAGFRGEKDQERNWATCSSRRTLGNSTFSTLAASLEKMRDRYVQLGLATDKLCLGSLGENPESSISTTAQLPNIWFTFAIVLCFTVLWPILIIFCTILYKDPMKIFLIHSHLTLDNVMKQIVTC